MSELNTIGSHLMVGLSNAVHNEDTETRAQAQAEKVNVVGAGETLTAAYEQLRNAAENAKDESAIR